MRTISLRSSFVQTMLATALVAVGCGDDTSNTGGNNNTGGSGGENPTTGGNPPVGGEGEGGQGGNSNPVIECVDVESAAPDPCSAADPDACICAGCDLTECTDGATFNDCICASCAADSFCLNPDNCMLDGACDPYNEGCLCADCADHPSCASGWIEDCTNDADDNGNGLVDCADVQCASQPACLEDCGNGTDDDGNGATDCDDSQCFDDPTCEEDCVNTTDDNGNGLIDCLDAVYCSEAATCVAPVCADTTAAVLGANNGDTTGGTNALNSNCSNPGTPETVYTFTPATTGFMSITLAAAADDLGFSVRSDCADIETELICADAVLAGEDEIGVIEVVAAEPVTIIVNGFEATDEGPFTLTLAVAADGACIDDGVCSAELGEGCACTDCADQAVCGACDATPASCDQADACTCASCDADAFCTDPDNCTDDGFCDQFLEGCQCDDCGAVPNCID